MAYLHVKEDKLAISLRVLKNASAILYIIVNTDERGQTIYGSLKKAEGLVKDLDDELLIKLYNKVFSVFHTGDPNQQIVPSDYFAFIERLGTLLEEATAQANETHLALREAIGFESVIGSWEGRRR